MKKPFTVSQAAKELGITRARMDQLIREGRIQVTVDPVSEWRLIDCEELERFKKLCRPPGRPDKHQRSGRVRNVLGENGNYHTERLVRRADGTESWERPKQPKLPKKGEK